MTSAAAPQTPQNPQGAAARAGEATTTSRRRWIAALIVAFVLGFILAWLLLRQTQLQPNCARSPQDGGPPPPAASGRGRGEGAPGPGSPTKLGSGGSGESNRRGGGPDSAAEGGGGAAAAGAPGDGSLGTGQQWQARGEDHDAHGSSSAPDTAAGAGRDPRGEAPDGRGGEDQKNLPNQAQGGAPGAPGAFTAESGDVESSAASKAAAVAADSNTRDHAAVARDLRYDASQLPRYPNAVSGLASGAPLPPGALAPSPNVSVSTILTTDDPGTVAAWYRAHLPPDWSQTRLGGLAMFWPPDRNADPRSVWIVLDEKTGRTAALLWKPK